MSDRRECRAIADAVRRFPGRGAACLFLAASFLFAVPAAGPATARAVPYWVFFQPAPREDASKEPLALSPRAIARLRKTGHRAGTDLRDHAIGMSELAPLTERAIAVRNISRWLRAASAVLTEDQARDLAADPRVLSVRPVIRFAREITPPPVSDDLGGALAPPRRRASDDDPAGRDPRSLEGPDYGDCWEQLEMLGVPELHRRGYSGLGVLVAIFDTGFYKTHQCLSRLDIAAERDFACGDGETQWQPGETCLPRDADSHGTYVWSVLGGYAPGTQMGAAYRASFVLARTEEIGHEIHLEEDSYIAALEWADSLGVDIVSTSLGYRRFDDGSSYTPEQLDGETIPITQATEIASERGILVVTAMGNNGPEQSTLIAPADGKRVVSVGAVDFAGAVASFSSRGPTGDGRIKPDVCANGVMTAAALADTPGSYGRVGGTSLATPLIAGLAALLLEARPAWTPDSLIAALHGSGGNAADPSNALGWGIADGPRALEPAAVRLRVEDLVWTEEGGSQGTIDWGEQGRLVVWLRNEGGLASLPGSVWIGSHDGRLHPVDSSAIALIPIEPGERDSVGFSFRIDNDEQFALAGFFLEALTGDLSTVRKVSLAIPRPYELERFDVQSDPTGTCALSWRVRPIETTPLGSLGYRLYREGSAGEREPLQEGSLDWWIDEWTDRPPGPGLYRYWLEIKMLGGRYVALEGPREVRIQPPVLAAIGHPYPNPVRSGNLLIPLAWAGEDDPLLQIFDPAGRRIRTLAGRALESGFPIVLWDLKDLRGRPAPSGLYLLRLPGVGSARVLIVR